MDIPISIIRVLLSMPQVVMMQMRPHQKVAMMWLLLVLVFLKRSMMVVSLLQQVNMLPSSSSSPPASANHIHTTNSPSLSDISSTFSCSTYFKSYIWILGSGANEHIVSSTHWFTSFHKITHKPVNLPNGTFVLVHHDGTIHFSPQFYLDNVLYSPSFNLNLISNSNLC